MSPYGQKRDALLVSGKAKHQVLLFGKKLVGDWGTETFSHPNATIDVIPFPQNYEKLKRLSEYTLVILDYSAFLEGKGVHLDHLAFLEGKGVYKEQQEIFDKQMLDALEMGTTFCFVYFNEFTPPHNQYGYETGFMDEGGMHECFQAQIGYRWLNRFLIKPIQTDYLLFPGELFRAEFKMFLDKWGASHNAFSTYNEAKFEDVISVLDKYVLAFSLNVRNSRIIYLPFQRDFSRKDDFLYAIQTLMDSLLTYITKSLTELPGWASRPFFQEEAVIQAEYDKLERKLEETRNHLQSFEDVKSLLFQSEYQLESNIPQFISQNLEIPTERDEKYKEDFWILNHDKKRAIIVEVKSVVKGFKRSAIFSIYNHREANSLDESFPAVLIVNCNLQAGSWENKDRPIDKQDFQIAVQNNILIVRIEDLLRLWELKRTGSISSEEILGLLSNEKGWLQVNSKLQVKVNK